MPIPESSQTVDGVIEGVVAMLGTTFSLAQDAELGIWSGVINGVQAVVCEGQPGTYQPDIIIAVNPFSDSVTQAISRPVMGSNRPREIACEVKIVFSVFVAGADVAARAARQAVNAIAEPVQLYFRQRGQETLGGSCREAWVSDINGPHVANAYDSDGKYVIGRYGDSTLTITALIRN